MKKVEAKKDCFILDFDNPIDDHKLFVENTADEDLIFTLVSEKGQLIVF